MPSTSNLKSANREPLEPLDAIRDNFLEICWSTSGHDLGGAEREQLNSIASLASEIDSIASEDGKLVTEEQGRRLRGARVASILKGLRSEVQQLEETCRGAIGEIRKAVPALGVISPIHLRTA
jgi:hypothetical protein